MEETIEKRNQRIFYNWANQQNNSDQEDNYQDARDSSKIDSMSLLDLHLAKQRFKQFINQIGEFRKTQIREDILRYCQNHSKNQRGFETSYKPQTLLKKIQIRIQKMLKTKKIKRNWGEQDLKILIWIISKYCDIKQYSDPQKDLDEEDWKAIALLIPGVTPQGCMFKWLSLKKITLATNGWSTQQSNLLSGIVKERIKTKIKNSSQIKDWKQISQELYKMYEDQNKCFRNAKQCREHWTCYLSPQLKKGPWQLHEDVKLLKHIKDNKGMKKWSEIAKCFNGRTENALKNRYTLIIEKQRKVHKNRYKNQLDLIGEYLEKCYVEQFTTIIKHQHDIYEEQSDMRGTFGLKENLNEAELEPSVVKKEQNSLQQTVATPFKVQKVNLNDFSSLDLNFLKNIKPGIIETDGTFKRYDTYSPAVKIEQENSCFIFHNNNPSSINFENDKLFEDESFNI